MIFEKLKICLKRKFKANPPFAKPWQLKSMNQLFDEHIATLFNFD